MSVFLQQQLLLGCSYAALLGLPLCGHEVLHSHMCNQTGLTAMLKCSVELKIAHLNVARARRKLAGSCKGGA